MRRRRPTKGQLDAAIAAHEARELLRESQQGKGKPIIAGKVADHQLVAVGNKVYYGKQFKTFYDFLDYYLRDIFTPEWGNAEIAKPLNERHTLMQWYDALCAYQKRTRTKPVGEIQDTPATGVTHAYYGLAYNLYLLQHNAELQAYLIRRLKRPLDFHAAYYETFVAAWFILAGFDLKIENEQDSTRTHTEFIATKNDKSYSVEAKTRAPGKDHLAYGNQLQRALKKEAHHARVVFIDLNVDARLDEGQFVVETLARIKDREAKLVIDGQPAPPAYVFVTNQPYHLHLDDTNVPKALIGLGFKIPDFGHEVAFTSLIEAHKAKLKHADMQSVIDACRDYIIPTTFDGEISEFAFGEAERRFNIGQQYEIAPGMVGTLTHGIVVESEKKAWLAFHTADDQAPFIPVDLSDAELSAYRRHPETFFGRVVRQGTNAENSIDLFEFFLEGYKETPRDKLLEFFAEAHDLEHLSTLPDEDLRLIYAERCTMSVINRKAGPYSEK